MAEYAVDAGSEGVRALALELLRRAEWHASGGRPDNVEAILTEAWTLVEKGDAELAHLVAWRAAWMLFGLGVYDAARTWFHRIGAMPSDAWRTWPVARQVLLDLCPTLPNRLIGPTATPEMGLVSGAIPHSPGDSLALPPLHVHTLGRFQVVRGERPLPTCPSRKATAILRYLLIRPHRSARKEELIDLLWPDAPAREATHSLHVAVSTLRRYLDSSEGSYVCLETGRYTVNPEAVISDDCEDFRRLAGEGERYWRAGDLERAQESFSVALGCYQGDYYLDDDDAGWAATEQERILAQYITVLDHLGQVLILQGAFEEAAECYRKLLERDAYREDAHAQLIRCYLHLGQRSTALRQYKRCAAVLERDLGLHPTFELESLYRGIATESYQAPQGVTGQGAIRPTV